MTGLLSKLSWRLARLADLPRDLRGVLGSREAGVDYRPYLLGKFGWSMLPGEMHLPRGVAIHDDGSCLRVTLGQGLALECPKRLNERQVLEVMLRDVLASDVYRCDAIKPGAHVLDCGGNIGVFSCHAAALAGPTGRVYAWEPVAEVYEALLRNVRDNHQEQVVCICKGLADEQGRAGIHVPAGMSGRSSLEEGGQGRLEDIELTTLDSEVERLGLRRVDLIKLDVEGYEEKVLRGAARTLRAFRPVLSMAAYHHEEDRWRLPAVIRGMEPAYHVTVSYSGDSTYIFATCGAS